jgi:hypothetical protein
VPDIAAGLAPLLGSAVTGIHAQGALTLPILTVIEISEIVFSITALAD